MHPDLTIADFEAAAPQIVAARAAIDAKWAEKHLAARDGDGRVRIKPFSSWSLDHLLLVRVPTLTTTG